MTYTINQLADLIEAKVVGNRELEISGINKIEESGSTEISFLHNPKYFDKINSTKAGAVIVPLDFSAENSVILLQVPEPYMAFLKILKLFYPEQQLFKPVIHQQTAIAENAVIGKNPSIGSFVTICDDVRIGENVRIAGNVFIGNNVKIGDNVLIYANCSIRENCVIGNNVILQNGAIIGSDGFGFAPENSKYEKIPQVGNVIIEDDVEIGANTVIDRATLGSTIICRGTKLDNLIQIAHNVKIGHNVVIAAQSGVSGSTQIGDHCMIGGQTGFVGHIKIGNGVMVGAQAGITGNVKDGSVITGTPARDLKKMRMIDGALSRIPDLIYKVRELEKMVKVLAPHISNEENS